MENGAGKELSDGLGGREAEGLSEGEAIPSLRSVERRQTYAPTTYTILTEQNPL